MMQNIPPLREISTEPTEPFEMTTEIAEASERLATIWTHRITGAAGAICLLVALGVWAGRPGHYRLVLALLTVAMFAAIIHSYTFEDGSSG